jgi:membrane protein
VAAGTAHPGTARSRVRRGSRAGLWRLTRETVRICFRYRVTGLAAEAGFFALLSLPPLILGLVGTLGYLDEVVGEDIVTRVQSRIIELASQALSAESVREVLIPTLDDVLRDGRFDVISLGFLLSLWSGSRALNVYVDTITIMYGLSGHRGIIRTRMLSFSLYVVGLVMGIVLVPLVLAGPTLVDRALPESFDVFNVVYWPLVVLLSVAFLATLYHVSVPVRTAWVRAVPGSVLALAMWLGGSYVVRWIIDFSVDGPSVYGPLAAPIVIMIWLYVLAISVLIGAALNAAVDRLWPARSTEVARDSSDTGETDTAGRTENPLTPVAPDA